MRTLTEKYRAVLSENLSKDQFLRDARLAHPTLVTQYNGYSDAVQILKNRGFISEAEEVLNVDLNTLERGIRFELGISHADDTVTADWEKYERAKAKAEANLKKDVNHYLNILAGESDKVDKHDREIEVKQKALFKDVPSKDNNDTFNAMKKATLKEEAVESVEVVKPTLKESVESAIKAIHDKYGNIPGINKLIKDFIKTHSEDLMNGVDPVEEFDNFVSVNYDSLQEEKAKKDFDGDGKIESPEDEYLGSRDKAIKKAQMEEGRRAKMKGGKVVTENDYDTGGYVESMGPRLDKAITYLISVWDEWKEGPMTEPGMIPHAKKDLVKYIENQLEEGDEVEEVKGLDEESIKESITAIISNILSEQVITEAATKNLADLANVYSDYDGMKEAIIKLENIVTEIELFYDKVGRKIQDVYDTLGEITNEEGLKVGAFVAPTIQKAFRMDLLPLKQAGFDGKATLPKVKTLSQADIDAHNSGARPLGEEEELEEKQTIFKPVKE